MQYQHLWPTTPDYQLTLPVYEKFKNSGLRLHGIFEQEVLSCDHSKKAIVVLYQHKWGS